MASEITSVSIVYSTVCSGADQRQHQRSISLAFERGIHQWPVNSPHKGTVMEKMFPFDDVITLLFCISYNIVYRPPKARTGAPWPYPSSVGQSMILNFAQHCSDTTRYMNKRTMQPMNSVHKNTVFCQGCVQWGHFACLYLKCPSETHSRSSWSYKNHKKTEKAKWCRVIHICVSYCKLTIIGSDNGLSDRHQAIIWSNAGILLIGPLGTNFSEIWFEIHTFSLKNAFESVVWKIAAILSWPQRVK